MKCTLLGIKEVEFTDDKGIFHKGQQAFIEYNDPSVFGNATDKVWLSGNLMLPVIPDFPSKVIVEYFRNRLVDFTVIK